MSRLSAVCGFFLFFAIFTLFAGAEDYCSICGDHTMCINHNTRPACNAMKFGLTPQERKEIVELHNKYRQRVASGNERRGNPGPQPPAKYMPNLEWDDELAEIAQRSANTCRYGHDSCRNVRRFSVGQNIATMGTTGSSPFRIENMINMWYDEVALFNSHQVENIPGPDRSGHYIMMMWAGTTRVGCGYLNYMDGGFNTVYLVCNYGPASSLRGRMYEIRR